MNRLRYIITLLCLALLSLAAQAAVKVGDIWYELNNPLVYEATVISSPYEGVYGGDINIPSTIEFGGISYSITSIGNSAFADCSDLTSVTIPNSVTSIGSGAFAQNGRLTSVNIPSSVTSIGSSTFVGCGLTSVTIPNTVTSIGDYAFLGCSSLTSVTIPNSVTSIGVEAFNSCSRLLELSLEDSDSLLYLGEKCFSYETPIKKIYIGRNWTASGYTSFFPKVTSVTLGEKVTMLPDYAFSGCSGLTSVTIPNTVTSIGDCAFQCCSGLTSVTIPNSVTSIGDGAFSDCSGLASMTIPESVISIGSSAFVWCSGLTSVTIGNSVTSIGDNAFDGCAGLKKSAYPNTLDNPFPKGIVIAYDPQGAIVEDEFVFGPNKSSILFAPYYLFGEYIIPNSITSVGASAFAGCKNLSSIEFGSGIKSILDNAFAGCGLSKVVLPPAVDSIGNSAFAGNAYLTEVAIGPNVKSISDKAFDSTPLQRVYITAPEPPAAPYSAFSKYTAKLYVQGKAGVNAYYDATSCWDRFDGYAMSEPTRINIEMPERLPRNAGDTFTLKATLEPENVDLPYVFWRSTNPEIAYVDNYGNVTVRQDIPTTGDVKIIAETLYHNGPAAYFSFNSVTTDTDEVLTDTPDELAPVDVYNLQGVQVLRVAEADAINTLTPGVYIVRQGNRTSKIAVK